MIAPRDSNGSVAVQNVGVSVFVCLAGGSAACVR